MKYGQKLNLGDAHVTPRNIQELQASKLGDAPQGKNQVTFRHTIFLLLHILCIFLGESLLLLSVFFSFVCRNKWLAQTNFFWRRFTLFFIAKNILVFTLIVQRVFSFSRTTFSFCFLP
jgi:hypothetical protein